MTWVIISSVFVGIIIGKIGFLSQLVGSVDMFTTIVLNILLFVVGIDLGRNRTIWKKLKELGWKILLIPLGTVIGSLGGAFIIGFFLKMDAIHAMAVGAGFGWYSLSGVMLQKMVSIEIGTIAFLSNIFREVLALALVPIVARKFGKIPAVAPGGATTMDTTLPIIVKSTSPDMAIIAFIHGLVLTFLVPFLVPIIVNL
ncbi:Membrane protein of unknown function [Desulfonispora thiosulfatigenes DSM 11270]|uniref:Lysine exporter LysO family protein n=1 Tax=Desulfonispora thiosulfatigenes DSM 11270 TaxID=656914 RepID=A0A1W1UZ27_DESTI|nr:lysine exporter LysO family protein [Desulfonispora thiosulfatigenes]SMB86363.1 Membrane protein of unknown function [Desulfonispora thiosulfatigenes DSM 11270]